MKARPSIIGIIVEAKMVERIRQLRRPLRCIYLLYFIAVISTVLSKNTSKNKMLEDFKNSGFTNWLSWGAT